MYHTELQTRLECIGQRLSFLLISLCLPFSFVLFLVYFSLHCFTQSGFLTITKYTHGYMYKYICMNGSRKSITIFQPFLENLYLHYMRILKKLFKAWCIDHRRIFQAHKQKVLNHSMEGNLCNHKISS